MKRILHCCMMLMLMLAPWLALACQVAGAQQIITPRLPVIRMPVRGGVAQGFTAAVEIAEHNIAGYVPVEIVVTSTARFTADRRLLFRLSPTPDGRTPPQSGLLIDIPVNINQGTKSSRVLRYMPKWSAGHAYQCVVLEEGLELEDYVGATGTAVQRGRRPQFSLLDRETLGRSLFIDTADIIEYPSGAAEIEKLFAPANEDFAIRVGSATELARPERLLGQIELPDDWRGYQRFDVVIVTQESLSRIAQQEAKWKALRQWVLVGGAIVCLDAPSPEALSASLNFSWTDDQDIRSFVVAVARNLIGEQKSAQQNGLEQKNALQKLLQGIKLGVRNSANAMGGMGMVDEETAAQDLEQTLAQLKQIAAQPSHSANQWGDQVWVQSAGGGLVIGFRESESAASMLHWQIADAVISYRRSPMLRRGVDPLIGDSRFTRWMIPGVAQPPVYTFIGLLTVFVILVGPIAYRRTTRYGRGYLMFAIAPILAMVTTLAMFGYGIVADGFGTMARVRQLTWIDGASGDAGERIRSTYFAGVRPGDGLRFPGDAEVIRYPQSAGRSWEDLNELTPALIGKVRLTEKSQAFDRSFLPSREQRQFVLQRPRSGVGKILMKPGTDPGKRRLESTLDFALDRVIVRDPEGNFWAGNDLAAGGFIDCQSLTAQDASKALGKMYNEHRPISEVREASQPRNRRREARDLIINSNRAIGDGSRIVTDGVFEQWLVERLRLSGDLPRGSFVATAAVSDDVLAVKDVELVESIRYVFGTMP